MEVALQEAREGAEEIRVAEGCDLSAADIRKLFDALRQGTSELSFGPGCLQKGEAMSALAITLAENNTLTSIRLEENEIGPEGAQAMAKALETNTTLTSIDLWQNQIGPEGAQAVAKALETNKALTDLILWQNQIGPEGAQAVAKALETNTALTNLNLYDNEIGPEGARAVAKALETNTTLKAIDLNRNAIGPEGAQAVAKALETNKTLTALTLNCEAESVTFFVEALRSNATLRTLRLATKADDIPVDVVAALNQVIHLGKTGLSKLTSEWGKELAGLDAESKAILAANQARYKAEAAGPTRVAQGATRALDDSRFGQDRLGYVPYAQALADAATSAQSPGQSVSIGLFARWGSGKSFLMEKLKLELRRTALLPAADAYLCALSEPGEVGEVKPEVVPRNAWADALVEAKPAAP